MLISNRIKELAIVKDSPISTANGSFRRSLSLNQPVDRSSGGRFGIDKANGRCRRFQIEMFPKIVKARCEL